MKVAAKASGPYSWTCQQSSIGSFNWADTLEEYKKKCPLLLAAITGSLTNKQSTESMIVGVKRKKSVKPAIGMITSQILFKRNPQKHNLCQKMNGMMMWLAGCRRRVGIFKMFTVKDDNMRGQKPL